MFGAPVVDELNKLRSEFLTKFDAVILWAQSNFAGEPPWTSKKRPHRRLKTFMEEYEFIFNKSYQVRDYAAEGGAAKRTEVFLDDDHYFQEVRKFFDDPENPEGCHYLKFIKSLESQKNNMNSK